MNKSILSLLTFFSLLVVSYGVHAHKSHVDEVCYTVDGGIYTVNNFRLNEGNIPVPDGTQSGTLGLSIRSAFGAETYYLEGDIDGTITQVSPEGLPEKLAHDMTGTITQVSPEGLTHDMTGSEWAIHTKDDRVFFTGVGDFGETPTPVLESVSKLSKIAPSLIGSTIVNKITLVVKGEISFYTGNNFEQVSGILCTQGAIGSIE